MEMAAFLMPLIILLISVNLSLHTIHYFPAVGLNMRIFDLLLIYLHIKFKLEIIQNFSKLHAWIICV